MQGNVSTSKEVEFYTEYYSRFASRYDSYVLERSAIVAKCLLEWTDLDGKKILDLGIGTASVWENILKESRKRISVLGIDIVPAMLRIAREKNIPFVELREGNIEIFEDDESYDLVVASSILRHLPDLSIGVLKANDLLTERGEFLVEEQTLEDSHYQLLPEITDRIAEYWKPVYRDDSFMMGEEELLRIVSSSGFRRKRYEGFSYDQEYGSFEEISDVLVNDTMWGMTYQRIERKHRQDCDDILMRTLKDRLKEPVLPRRIFVSLFTKARS